MKKIAVFFGGVSPEHDVSCITGLQAIAALDDKKYEIISVFVAKTGVMYNGSFNSVSDIKNLKKRKSREVKITRNGLRVGRKFIAIDCALLCFHGASFEGGGFASLLESSGIAYTSSDPVQSGIAMDKSLQKLVATALQVPVLPFETANCVDGEISLSLPVVVKPNSLGSSIGVSVCKTQEELKTALDLALRYDEKAIVEKKAADFYELNISVLGYCGKTLLSEIEKPISSAEFLTFSEKYLRGGKKSGMKSLSRECPAKITVEMRKTVEQYAKTLYEKIGLSGIVRFDFLVEKNKVYFNEVNVIPGSLSWYLWTEKGIGFSRLLDMAIEEGEKKLKDKNSKIRTIDTEVLK